jgi:hypothetical protein
MLLEQKRSEGEDEFTRSLSVDGGLGERARGACWGKATRILRIFGSEVAARGIGFFRPGAVERLEKEGLCSVTY